MKKIIAIILALLIFSVPAFAQTTDTVELITIDGVDVYGVGDEVLGMDKEEFKEYIKENNIILYGIAKDKSFVIEVSCEETEFSKSVKDFKNIKLSDIKDFADSTNIPNYNIEQLGDAVYIIRDIPSNDSENAVKVLQFITVKQEFLYIISITDEKNTDIDKTKSVISSIVYNLSETPQSISVWHIVLVSVAIILVLMIFIFVTITVIKDLRKRKSEEATTEEE